MMKTFKKFTEKKYNIEDIDNEVFVEIKRREDILKSMVNWNDYFSYKDEFDVEVEEYVDEQERMLYYILNDKGFDKYQEKMVEYNNENDVIILSEFDMYLKQL